MVGWWLVVGGVGRGWRRERLGKVPCKDERAGFCHRGIFWKTILKQRDEGSEGSEESAKAQGQNSICVSTNGDEGNVVREGGDGAW